MNGPSHYRMAEEILAGHDGCHRSDIDAVDDCVAVAQVHALLAHIAATVGSAEQDLELVDEHVEAWAAVLT